MCGGSGYTETELDSWSARPSRFWVYILNNKDVYESMYI